MIVVAPWTIRNRVVLGRWVPIKSNGMYELWQSQCLDDDGVFDWKTCSLHPWPSAGTQRIRYKEIGEVAFIDEKGDLALASIRANPLSYLNRVFNRWIAACVYYNPFNEGNERYFMPVLLKRIVFPLPLIGVVLIFAIRKHPIEPEILATVSLLTLCLFPYVMISYYERYATPLIGMKILTVIYAVNALFARKSAAI